MIAQNRVAEIIDKDADKGALLYVERDITDKATGPAHRHHHVDHVSRAAMAGSAVLRDL